MIYFQNEFAQINYLEDEKTIEIIWNKRTSSEMYRALFTKGVEALAKHSCTNWISDTTNQGLVAPDDRKWLESQKIPEAIKSGLRNIAVLVSKDVFKKYYVDSVKKQVEKSHLSMQYFEDRENAIQWIRECNNASIARSA